MLDLIKKFLDCFWLFYDKYIFSYDDIIDEVRWSGRFCAIDINKVH